MLEVNSVPAAIGVMLAGVFLLGTWPAVWHLVEQRGRVPAHTFLDYAFTYLACGVAAALTLGQLGPAGGAARGLPSLNFLDQIRSPPGPLAAFALAGGACLALGDLAMQYSTALLGLAVGPALLNAVTVVVGVVLTFFLDGGINKPALVFPGAACATAAIALGAAAHVAAHRGDKAATAAGGLDDSARGGGSAAGAPPHSQKQCGGVGGDGGGRGGDTSAGRSTEELLEEEGEQRPSLHADVEHQGPSMQLSSSCSSLHAPQLQPHERPEQQLQQPGQRRHCSAKRRPKRSIDPDGKPAWLGLAVALVGGAVYSLFLPAIQIAANDPFGLLRRQQQQQQQPLSIYTSFFFFSVGFSVVSLAANAVLLARPALGAPRSSVVAYLADHRGRGLSVLSGLLAAGGDLCQFVGSQAAGYAAGLMVMAYPLVGALWSLRFRRRGGDAGRGSRRATALVAGQVAAYAAAVALLASAAELRGSSGHHE